MKIKHSLIIVLMLFLSFCSKDDNDIDSFAFGTAAGECYGNCARFFLIKNNNLYPDDMDYYYNADLKFQNEPLSVDKYNLAKSLVDDFPIYLKNNPNKTFGCPDCYDQGGVHIEINRNGDIEIWHIDMSVDSQPTEIRNYIQEMLNILEQL